MKKNKANALLQSHARKLLFRIKELEMVELDLKVHGEPDQGLGKVKAAYRQLLSDCFDGIDWEDPG